MVTDGYDAGAPLVPYLNWSSYRRSLILLQGSLLLTSILFFVGPYIPIRPILLLAGEGAFIANHPWLKPAVEGLLSKIGEEKKTGKTALGRKLAEQRAEGLKAYTVVVDRRQGGMTGHATYYYREGLGSFRLGSMTKVSLGELKRIVNP